MYLLTLKGLNIWFFVLNLKWFLPAWVPKGSFFVKNRYSCYLCPVLLFGWCQVLGKALRPHCIALAEGLALTALVLHISCNCIADVSEKIEAIHFSHLWLGWEVLMVVSIFFQTVNWRRYYSGNAQGTSIFSNGGLFLKHCFTELPFVWLLFKHLPCLRSVCVQEWIPWCFFTAVRQHDMAEGSAWCVCGWSWRTASWSFQGWSWLVAQSCHLRALEMWIMLNSCWKDDQENTARAAERWCTLPSSAPVQALLTWSLWCIFLQRQSEHPYFWDSVLYNYTFLFPWDMCLSWPVQLAGWWVLLTKFICLILTDATMAYIRWVYWGSDACQLRCGFV